jgi:Tfp pilus assembly protein PilO
VLTVVAFGALLALNVAVLAAFTLPRALADRKARAAISDLRTRRDEQARATATAVRSAQAVVANHADEKRFYEETIPGRDGLSAVLNDVEGMARDAGVRALRRSFKDSEVKGAKLVAFDITMPVAGTYGQIADYLKRLESSPRLLVIEEIRLRERPNEPGGGTADLDVEIKTYLKSDRTGK